MLTAMWAEDGLKSIKRSFWGGLIFTGIGG